MHRIDGVGATPDNKFTQGNPGAGVIATQVTDDIMNALQEEICGVIESTGAVLSKADNTQLLNALMGARTHAANGYQKLLSGLIIQWGACLSPSASTGTVTFPIAFTTACYAVVVTDHAAGGANIADQSVNEAPTLTNFTWYASDSAQGPHFFWIAIGK